MRFILRMPPSVALSLLSSSVSFAASFFAIRSNSPACCRASSCSSRPIRFLIVTKFVSMPPSQRLLTYGMAGAGRLLGDRLLGLLLGADEQHLLAPGDRLADGLEGEVQALDGLGEIDDVDPVALREDERAHLGIPAARLVAEVDSGLEQLPHRNGRHGG